MKNKKKKRSSPHFLTFSSFDLKIFLLFFSILPLFHFFSCSSNFPIRSSLGGTLLPLLPAYYATGDLLLHDTEIAQSCIWDIFIWIRHIPRGIFHCDSIKYRSYFIESQWKCLTYRTAQYPLTQLHMISHKIVRSEDSQPCPSKRAF